MLEFKRPAKAPEPQPRWEVGTDRKHLTAYMSMALIAGLAIGFVAGRYAGGSNPQPAKKPANELNETASKLDRSATSPVLDLVPANEYRKVTNVIHADTIELEGAGTVRMIGVESPDRKSPEESYGDQAKDAVDFTKNSLLGKEVRLEYDPANAGTGNRNEAGEVLAYVYTRDGVLFNAEMIKQGRAFARVADPYKMIDDFRSYEREAMESMRGVWGPAGGATATNLPGSDTGHTSGSRNEDAKGKKLTPLLPSDLDPKLPSSAAAMQPNETVVYVSSADHMYHKAGCEYLDKKKHAIGLSEAKAAGYVACGRCFASTVMKAP